MQQLLLITKQQIKLSSLHIYYLKTVKLLWIVYPLFKSLNLEVIKTQKKLSKYFSLVSLDYPELLHFIKFVPF